VTTAFCPTSLPDVYVRQMPAASTSTGHFHKYKYRAHKNKYKYQKNVLKYNLSISSKYLISAGQGPLQGLQFNMSQISPLKCYC